MVELLYPHGRSMTRAAHHLSAPAGWMDLRMCLAIRSQQGQEEILRPYCAFCGLNAQFLLDMNGPRVRQLHTSSGSSGVISQVGRGGGGGRV